MTLPDNFTPKDKTDNIDFKKSNTLANSLMKSNNSKRQKTLNYDKSLKDPTLLIEKSKYKPVFTETSMMENRTKTNFFSNKKKELPHKPHSSKVISTKPLGSKLTEDDINNNRTKLIEDFEARVLKDTRKQLLTETSKNNEKNAKKINCLREKNLLDNILNTPKENDDGISEKMEKESELKMSGSGSDGMSGSVDNPQRMASEEVKNNLERSEESYDGSRIINTSQEAARRNQETEVAGVVKIKERVDPYEYFKRIYDNIEENYEEENSFRKSFSQKLKKVEEIKATDTRATYQTQTRLETEYYDPDAVPKNKKKFPENYKDELKYYMCEKKMQIKEEKVREASEKMAKSMKIYAGLYNISEKIKEDLKVNN